MSQSTVSSGAPSPTGDSRNQRWLKIRSWSALGLAVIAIILALLLRGTNLWGGSACPTSPTPAPTAVAGLSAYQLWLKVGNKGTEQDFLNSLVGTPGKDGYVGSNGVTGATGTPGAAGVCTVGETGATGAPGAAGSNGADGLSAYQVWLSNGHTGGTQSEFLASLVGAPGAPGAAGAQGPQGIQGPAGATGPAGPAGTSGLGASGSFWSTESQNAGAANTIHAMTLNQFDWQNGVVLESGSHLKMVAAGKYNIAFSAQVHQTNASGLVDIWLAKNGVAVPDSNTQLEVTANSPFMFAAWNFFVDAAAGDYYELMWSSDDSHTVIQYEPSVGAGASLHPAVPSLIVTVNQVG